jgi:hypothetical protein
MKRNGSLRSKVVRNKQGTLEEEKKKQREMDRLKVIENCHPSFCE